jgi:hypothetical protein
MMYSIYNFSPSDKADKLCILFDKYHSNTIILLYNLSFHTKMKNQKTFLLLILQFLFRFLIQTLILIKNHNVYLFHADFLDFQKYNF